MLNEEGPLLSLELGDYLTEWCEYTGIGWDPHKPNGAGKREKGGWDIATALDAFGAEGALGTGGVEGVG